MLIAIYLLVLLQKKNPETKQHTKIKRNFKLKHQTCLSLHDYRKVAAAAALAAAATILQQ